MGSARLNDDNRAVHARHADGREIVRYDREGHWFIEKQDPPRDRRRLSVQQAAILAHQEGFECFPGLWGGGAFERILRNLTPDE